MDDKQLGISIRMVQNWTPCPRDLTTQWDRAFRLALSDPRDAETPFHEKVRDALEYLRLNTH